MKIYELMNDIIGVEFLEARGGWCVDGLKYGNPEGEFSKVAVTLTATVDIIRAAKESPPSRTPIKRSALFLVLCLATSTPPKIFTAISAPSAARSMQANLTRAPSMS